MLDAGCQSMILQAVSSPLLSAGRQNNGSAMQPDDKVKRLLCFKGLSCRSSSHRLLRYRNKQKVCLPDEQFFNERFDSHTTVQVPLENRNLFQMDQTVSENQNIFRHEYQCCEDPNLDCHLGLCIGGDCKKANEIG